LFILYFNFVLAAFIAHLGYLFGLTKHFKAELPLKMAK
jgi:hypothetical protein